MLRVSSWIVGIWLCALSSFAVGADIVWVHQLRGPSWEDDQWRELLESNGHTIIEHDRFDELDLDPDGIEQLNSADVVIFSRDSNSGDYNNGDELTIWTEEITAPMIILSPYVIRSNRWLMVDSSDITDVFEPLQALDPNHPLFEGVPLNNEGLVEIWDDTLLGPDDNIDIIVTDDPGNGTVLAEEAETGYPWIIHWEAGVEFFDGSGTIAGGPRLFFAAGSDDDPNSWGAKNTTPAGDQILLNAIRFMTGGDAIPGDFNGDGQVDTADIDLLAAEVRAGTHNGDFDLTGDSLVDSQDHQTWVNDIKNSWLGDANLDGEFNSGDFVQVFQMGEYEDGVAGNSTWAEGDWNADGDFSSGDFVAAFQGGGFEQGPRAAVAAVPEPSAALLLLVGLSGLMVFRRR